MIHQTKNRQTKETKQTPRHPVILRSSLTSSAQYARPQTLTMEPTNWWLADGSPFPKGYFQVPAVSFRGCRYHVYTPVIGRESQATHHLTRVELFGGSDLLRNLGEIAP